MKLKKGSAAAKAYMAKIRAKRKVGGVLNTLKHGASLAKKKVAYNVIDKAAKSANKTEKSALTKAKKVIQNTYLGATKKDTFKVFYVGFKNRKIREKIEAKSAKDAIKEYQNRLKPIYGSVPATWLTVNKENTVGSTLKLKANEKRLGATAKDVKTRSKSYHKDTKSHNVNIKVVSGIGAISLDIVAKELNKLDSEISWHTINIKNEKNTTLKKELIYSKKIKTAQRKALISYLNSIAKFR